MSISRTATLFGAVAIVAIAPTACGGGDAFDPAGSAERGIHDQVLVELGLDSEVVCAEPANTDVGTSFQCLATDEEGKIYTFVAKILPDEVIGTRLD